MGSTDITSVETHNPATSMVIAGYAVGDASRIEAVVAQSRAAFRAWRDMPVERRADVLARFSATLEAETETCVLDVGHDGVDELLRDPHIAAVTPTGSVGAGATVASIASKLTKKSLLRLGGSDALIVPADADLDAAVATGLLPGHACRGGRDEHHDDRGSRSAGPAPGAAGLGGRAGSAMWLLPVRPDHAGLPPSRRRRPGPARRRSGTPYPAIYADA